MPVATSQTFVSSQTTSSTNQLNLTFQSSQNLTSTASHPKTVQPQDFAQTQKPIPVMDPSVNSRPSLTNGNFFFRVIFKVDWDFNLKFVIDESDRKFDLM